MDVRRQWLIGMACFALAACDPYADEDATGPYYQDCKTKGVWVDGDVFALTRPNGKTQLVMPDGFQYQGTVEGGADGGIVCDLDRNTFRAALPPGAAFPDGSTAGEGKVRGRIYVENWLDMTLNIKTSAGTSVPVTASLEYDPVHQLDASLATLAGSYQSGSFAASVDGTGRLFGQDTGNGCVANGTIEVIEGRFNMYEISVTQESCTGVAAVLNGLQGVGLGYYRPDNGSGADRLVLAVITPSGARLYSTTWVLDRD